MISITFNLKRFSFFFSSRRRHTRYWRDWSSDVCSSDLAFDAGPIVAQELFPLSPGETHDSLLAKCQIASKRLAATIAADLPRLWAAARPQAGGSYWPRIRESERTLDFTRDVADLLRQV